MAVEKQMIPDTGVKKLAELEEQLEIEIENPDSVSIGTEDGGVVIDFEGNKTEELLGAAHDSNLAEYLEDAALEELSSELIENFNTDRQSRGDWAKSYVKGLDLLGMKIEERQQPWSGASGVFHPVLTESIVRFQAQAMGEIFPAAGPVRTKTVGKQTREKTEQAARVENEMNYLLTEEMTEYRDETEQMLFKLPLAGSAFKKVYYDPLLERPCAMFVPAEDFVVSYGATDLMSCIRYTHVMKKTANEIAKLMVNGFYKDLDLPDPEPDFSDIQEKYDELDGESATIEDDDRHTLLEIHADLELPEPFQDKEGIARPYVVTIDKSSKMILSIRRNYYEDDEKKKKIQYFVHFKFLPGLGFYGFGLIHMIGGLSRTATAALRSLLDAGTFSNQPSGFKMRGIKLRDEAAPLQPGEFRDVDAPGGNLRDAFMPLPFKEPSQTLLQLMGVVVGAGQRFASIADLQVGDGNQNAAVGTTVAMLERGSRTMSAIHKRLYASMKREFGLMARVFKLYLPPVYPYDVVGGQRQIKQSDFDDRIDILPVADPNIFSQTQRISLAQTEMQLAASNPAIHNQYEVYRNMYEALGVKDIDLILKKPEQPMPKDPALEHIDALAGKPFQAFPGQDHQAHITAHLNFMETNMVKNSPVIGAAIQKNILEHISLMAQEQIEMEFREELPKLAQMQQMAMQNPQVQQEMRMLTEKIEGRKAILVSEMMEDFKNEEKKITSQFDNDPIAALRARELDLQAKENARKEKEGEERLNLDKMRAMMNDQNQDEKLKQNEELAKLRADTSIQKTILGKTIPSAKETPDSISIIRGDN